MLAPLHASSFPQPSLLSTSANSQPAALKSDDNFFAFNASSGVGRSQKHLEYLNNSSKELAILHSHTEMNWAAMRSDTLCLPSSAPVERQFSSGALVLTEKRNKLSDSLFDKLLLLNLSRNYWWQIDCLSEWLKSRNLRTAFNVNRPNILLLASLFHSLLAELPLLKHIVETAGAWLHVSFVWVIMRYSRLIHIHFVTRLKVALIESI